MANPQFIEQKSLSLVDVKEKIEIIEKRDKELNYLSNKAKEYLETFVKLDSKQKEELTKKYAFENESLGCMKQNTDAPENCYPIKP